MFILNIFRLVLASCMLFNLQRESWPSYSTRVIGYWLSQTFLRRDIVVNTSRDRLLVAVSLVALAG